jgi:catechol 2,3-dioxygenase-like lactoylglutathione lyase family enzyme
MPSDRKKPKKKTTTGAKKKKKAQPKTSTTKAKVTGVGGVFIYANDAKALSDWYADRLGIATVYQESEDNYCAFFAARDLDEPETEVITVFAIFQSRHALGTERHEFRVNYRVSDRDGMLAQLREKDVKIERVEDSPYGRFAWIRDPEGNRIELYQPS